MPVCRRLYVCVAVVGRKLSTSHAQTRTSTPQDRAWQSVCWWPRSVAHNCIVGSRKTAECRPRRFAGMSLSHVTVICTNRTRKYGQIIIVSAQYESPTLDGSGNLLPPIYAADRQIRNLSSECSSCKLFVSWSWLSHCTGIFRIFYISCSYQQCFSSSMQGIDLSPCKMLGTHTDTQLITHSCHLMSESKNNIAAHTHRRPCTVRVYVGM